MLSFQIYVKENLIPAIIPAEDGKLPLLVLDNHASHHDKLGLLDDVAEKLYTPPMSCLMNNPIETAWSQIKATLQKKQLNDVLRHRQEVDFLWDVTQSVREVVSRNQDAFMKAGNKYILEYLHAARDLLGEDELIR